MTGVLCILMDTRLGMGILHVRNVDQAAPLLTHCLRFSATAGSTCEAIRIYNKEGDSAPLWTQYNCVHNWNAFSVYRTLTDTSTSELTILHVPPHG